MESADDRFLFLVIKEQNVGIPVPRGEGRPAGPQGFLPEQRSSSTVEQIIDVARVCGRPSVMQ